MLKIIYQNVRGLRTKTAHFKRNISVSSGNVHCITESWLHDGFRDAELCGGNVNVFRKDRNYAASNSSKGGGVLVIANRDLTTERLADFESNLDRLEDVWIRIRLSDARWAYICTVYLSPFQGNYYLYESFLNKLMQNSSLIDSKDELIVVGDFNCPEISGFFSCNNHQLTHGRAADSLLNAFSFCNFSQFNKISYSAEQFTILDLVLANAQKTNISVNRSSDPLVAPDIYHPPLSISVTLSPMLVNVCPFTLNFRKANYARINQDLVDVDWDNMHHMSVDDATSHLYSVIDSVIASHVSTAKRGRKYPVWFLLDLIARIKEKNKLHKISKRNASQITYEAYRSARASCKSKNEEDYNKYINELQVDMSTNIKKFWAYSKMNNQTNNYPSVMKLGHTTSSDSDGIANLFATNFGMVVTELCPPITDQFEPHSNPTVPTVPQLAFPEAEVLGTLASCDASKRGGPDGIPGIFLKNCAHTLAKPFR